MADFRHFHGLARHVQSIRYPGLAGQTEGKMTMTNALNNALAAVAALTLTLLCMATAIVPATPAGMLF